MSARIINAGGKFSNSGLTTFTVITAATISDEEGNVIGSYDANTTYQGTLPTGTFVVTTGSIKLWS